jgi:multiple sugar transport system permease protein
MTSLSRRGSGLAGRAAPYLFLAPALVVTTAIVFWPVLQTAWMSLFDYSLLRPKERPFIGLGNFARAMSDEVFWISLWQSVIWITACVAGQLLLGLLTGVLLNRSFWWRGVARALVIIPWALPSVIIALMWSWMYDFNLGLINDLGLRLGLLAEPVPWLAQPRTAFWAVVLVLIWQGFPFFAIVVLAGLQSIPKDLYEAAAVDGATAWQGFVRITLPCLMPVLMTALLLRTIWVANSLDVILVMTGGGPGYATHTLPLYAFIKAYSSLEFGYGSALALILTVMLMGVVALYIWRLQREQDR